MAPVATPMPASKGADMSELASSALHDTRTVNLALAQC